MTPLIERISDVATIVGQICEDAPTWTVAEARILLWCEVHHRDLHGIHVRRDEVLAVARQTLWPRRRNRLYLGFQLI